MRTIGATEARKNWSSMCDSVARVRPEIIKRTHDFIFLASLEDMLALLTDVKFRVSVYSEEDGSCTVTSDVLDIAENAENEELALSALAGSILEYAGEYFDNYRLYSIAPNRSQHIAYVTKAFLLDDAERIREEIICQNGKS